MTNISHIALGEGFIASLLMTAVVALTGLLTLATFAA
jgi:hypothetical protein